MDVKIIHSGSKGNCAVIDDALIIDAGWNVSPDGVAVFLTHHHGDHTKYLDKMFGMPIYALQATIDKLQMDARFAYTAFSVVQEHKTIVINVDNVSYYVNPLPVDHDAPCVSYDITKVCNETGAESRIFFGTDFVKIVDEDAFVNSLRDKVYDAIYIEANNTLNPTDFLDIYFPDGDDKQPKDAFHRTRSYQNHSNVDYIMSLFTRAGYSEENKFTEPITLLHKSSYYYPQNPERIVEFCKIAKITNPLY